MECIALTTHCVYKEDYKNGYQDLGNTWDGDTIRAKSLTELVKKIKNDFEVGTLFMEEGSCSNNLLTSFFEDEKGIRATKEDITKWKKGKIDLFEHIIKFKIYISATPEELELYSDYI